MKHESVQALFSQTADKYARLTAVSRGPVRITYGELEDRANGVANQLLSGGVVKGAIVAIFSDDSVDVITAMLGILKAGGVFLPFDPGNPAQRLRSIIAEVAPPCFLVQPSLIDMLKSMLGSNGASMLELNPSGQPAPDRDTTTPAFEYQADDMCYLYFTSGSTGRPKGIAGRLKGIDHFIKWEIETFGVGPGTRVSQLITPSFDAFLRDVLTPLCAGGIVCIPSSRDTILDARSLLAWIEQEQINLIHCIPSLFRALIKEPLRPQGLAALKYILLAGEPLLPADVRRWMDVYGERIRLVNLYGPSETTMTKFFYFVRPGDTTRRSIPIGQPMPGARALVLDGEQRPCAPGVIGEIYIRTPYRTLGYYRRPDLTAAVFVQNPFTQNPDDLIYKTGDLGRMLEDGNFEFLGRRDQQVKIRGVRIELREIEDLLLSHKQVRDAVLVDLDDLDGTKYLCAYVVLNESGALGSVKEHLARSLPTYMMPSAFVVMSELPRTVSGKVDRRALPKPAQVRSEAQVALVGPRTPNEEAIALLWCQILGFEQVSMHDSFFELGGHSLMATQLLSRVAATLGVEVPLQALFAKPTVESLALTVAQLQVGRESPEEMTRLFAEIKQLSEADPDPSHELEMHDTDTEPQAVEAAASQLSGPAFRAMKSARSEVARMTLKQRTLLELRLRERPAAHARPAISARPAGTKNLPLSFAQQRLWFIDQLEPNSFFFNISAAVSLQGQLDVPALQQALREIVRRHEALRTRFEAVSGEPRQVVDPSGEFDLPITSVADVAVGEREEALRKIIREESRRVFDLGRGPLLRVNLIRVGPDDHALVMVVHHIVCDGWSVNILVHELTALYEAYSIGQPSPLPELPIQYGDYALWQREVLQGEVLETQLQYWRDRLADAPLLSSLPTNCPRPPRQTYRGATNQQRLPHALSKALKDLSRREGVSLFMTLLAAFKALLYRYTGQEDMILGSPLANRHHVEIENLIGFFANPLILRTDLSGNPTFRDLLSRVREAALGAYAHQDVPFQMLVDHLQLGRTLSHHPLFQVSFTLDNPTGMGRALPELTIKQLEIADARAQLDLVLHMTDSALGLVAPWQYNTDLFDAATISDMADGFAALLEQVVREPNVHLQELRQTLLDEDKRRRLERERAAGDASLNKLKLAKRKAVSSKQEERLGL